MNLCLKKDVHIIVMTVVVDKSNILMMQEAKPSCYGLWYLPAGRLERYENLQEGAKRECSEETGLEINISSLLCLEISKNGDWIRVTFLAEVCGGEIKKAPDQESLTAAWLPLEIVINGGSKDFSLRSKDIVKVVKLWSEKHGNIIKITPEMKSYTRILLQLFVTVMMEKSESSEMPEDRMVLIDSLTNCAPFIDISHSSLSVNAHLSKFYQETFKSLPFSSTDNLPIVGLEYSGTTKNSKENTDGMLIKVSIKIKSDTLLILTTSTTYKWRHILESDKQIQLMNNEHLPQLLLL